MLLLVALDAALDAFLDRISSEYDPPINAFAMPSQSSTPSRDNFMPYHLTPLLASLPPFRTLLHEKLAAAYRTLPASVTDDDRATGARTLAERRMKLERTEEALVLAGTGLSRRPDASPAVVATTILQA